jgi:hypothetical protein
MDAAGATATAADGVMAEAGVVGAIAADMAVVDTAAATVATDMFTVVAMGMDTVAGADPATVVECTLAMVDVPDTAVEDPTTDITAAAIPAAVMVVDGPAAGSAAVILAADSVAVATVAASAAAVDTWVAAATAVVVTGKLYLRTIRRRDGLRLVPFLFQELSRAGLSWMSMSAIRAAAPGWACVLACSDIDLRT